MRTRILGMCIGGLVLLTTGCNSITAPTIAADGVWYGRINDPFGPLVSGLELTLATGGNAVSGAARRYVDTLSETASITGTQSGANLKLTFHFPQFDAHCTAYIHDAHHMTCRVDYGDHGAPEGFELARD